MTEIDSKEWYDAMFRKVQEILETLVLLDSAFVGYIQVSVEGQSITLSWTKKAVTVTAGDYKWQMPIGWFVDPDVIEKIITATTPAPVEPIAQPTADRQALVRAGFVGPDDEEPHSGEQTEDEPDAYAGESLLVTRPQPQAGVKSVDEIMREQGLGDEV